MMLLLSFAALTGCLALTGARDTAKFMKTVPTISNSLVNLGKMEIAFYFNGKHPKELQKHDHSTENFPLPQSEQACPCSNFKPIGPSFLSNPHEIINKILKSNDLFKDPTSAACCGSQEHMHENTIFFELGPNNAGNGPRNLNPFPFSSNSNIQRSPLPLPSFFFNKPDITKPKSVEILIYPKRKDMGTFEFSNIFSKKKDFITKPDIKVVGDKDLKVKSPSASVKKDLTLMEKKDELEPIEDLQTDSPPVTSVVNTL